MPCEEGLKLLDNESIDLTVTSPPYDNLRDYKGYSFDFETIAKELFRVTKKGGVVVWVVGDATINGSETGTSFKQALYFKEIGFNLHDTMIYWKNAFAFPEQNRYAQNFEFMFILSKTKPKTSNIIRVPTNIENRIKNKNSKYRTNTGETVPMKSETGKEDRNKENIWIYNVGFMHTNKEKYTYEHPAMFPELLVNDHVKSWSNENEVILDPFMGSGTTAKVSMKLNRKFIGFEISKEYHELAEKRVNMNIDLFTSI